MMKTCFTLRILFLILFNEGVFSNTNVRFEKLENSKMRSLSNEGFDNLNQTYFSLNEKILQLQRRVDTMEELTGVDDQCDCNQSEFKRSTSNELEDLSKMLSWFENEIRHLENEQKEFGRLLDGRDNTAELVCEDGWLPSHEGLCYYISDSYEKTNWEAAIEQCASKEAKLVEFKTDEQAEFVLNNMPEHISSNSLIYTGRKINEQNVWVFHSNGEPVDTSLRTWKRGEPDGGDQSCGCTKMSTDFRMSDCHCTGYSFHFICEKRPSVARKESPPTPPPRDCDSDWVPSRDKCYYYSTIDEKTTWATAQSRCQAKGGNLAEIKTDEEGIFVKNNIPSHIGARDILYTGRKMNDEGYWVFASSSERVDTTKRSWAKNEPSGRGLSQECGCTQFVGNLLMHDCYCTGYSVHFICEMIR